MHIHADLEGIVLSVTHAGRYGQADPVIREDGCLGRLTPGEAMLTVRPGLAKAFVVNADKGVTRRGVDYDFDTSAFGKIIPITRQESALTPGDDNQVRVLVLGDEGDLRIFLVSLVSQRGRFYLVSDQEYREQLYCDAAGAPVSPYFAAEWQAMNRAIGQLFGRDAGGDLPPVRTYPGEPDPLHDIMSFPALRGRVVSWDTAHQSGLVRFPEKGLVAVSWLQVDRGVRGGRQFLRPGEIVDTAGFAASWRRGVKLQAMAVKVFSRPRPVGR